MNKFLLFWLAVFFCGISEAKSDELVCHSYGHTNDSSEFHSIKVRLKETHFFFDQTGVTVGSRHYNPIDPAEVGLEGLAVTYLLEKEEQVLYLYRNDYGMEIGVSYIDPDTDTIFADKSLYSDCNFNVEGITHVVTREASGPETRRGQVVRTSSRF